MCPTRDLNTTYMPREGKESKDLGPGIESDHAAFERFGVSRANCLELIEKNRDSGYLAVVSPQSLESYIKEMGIPEETLYVPWYAANPVDDPFYRFLESFGETEQFQKKVEALPSYEEEFSPQKSRLANDNQVLAQMLAVREARPELCKKVSPSVPGDSA
jgi:hypothetical protein